MTRRLGFAYGLGSVSGDSGTHGRRNRVNLPRFKDNTLVGARVVARVVVVRRTAEAHYLQPVRADHVSLKLIGIALREGRLRRLFLVIAFAVRTAVNHSRISRDRTRRHAYEVRSSQLLSDADACRSSSIQRSGRMQSATTGQR